MRHLHSVNLSLLILADIEKDESQSEYAPSSRKFSSDQAESQIDTSEPDRVAVRSARPAPTVSPFALLTLISSYFFVVVGSYRPAGNACGIDSLSSILCRRGDQSHFGNSNILRRKMGVRYSEHFTRFTSILRAVSPDHNMIGQKQDLISPDRNCFVGIEIFTII